MRERGWQAALRERYGDSKPRTGADAGDAGGDAAAAFAARRAGAAVVCAAVVAALGEAGAPPSPQAGGLLAPPRQTPKADFEALRAAAAVLRGAERPLEALDVGEFLIDSQRAGAVAALVGVMHLRDTDDDDAMMQLRDTGTDDTGGRLRALQVALPHLNGGTRHVRVLMWTLGRLMIHAGWRAKDDLTTHSFTITELIRGAIAGPISKVNLSDGIRLGNEFVGTAECYRSSCTGVIAACRALSLLDRGVGGEVRRLTAMPTIDGDVEV